MTVPDICHHAHQGIESQSASSQKDNARPHRTRIMDAHFEQETIQRIQWLARSPDLNPIEHVWDFLR
ncbi:hypothetical protein TNCV_2577471 [Trichonephila clavipes]|nr:hypothetical protein TNCV_2577471 [Trichonephila clavipes]